jgi:hypothetical protein
MSELVAFTASDGNVLLVEVAERPSAGTVRGLRPAQVLEAAQQSCEEVVDNIAAPAQAIAARLAATEYVDEVEIEFAVRLTAEAGVVITKLVGEANFRVVLRLRRPKADATSGITAPVSGLDSP